jgi:hypothetical protein
MVFVERREGNVVGLPWPERGELFVRDASHTIAEADSSLAARSRPISSLKKGELHCSGDSITPSSDMYVYEYSLLTGEPFLSRP